MECHLCNQKFVQKQGCYRHLRQIHGVEPEIKKRNDEQTIEPFNFERDVERDAFKCRHCSRLFISSEERDRHETSHSRPKPYQCKHCTMSFSKHEHRKMHEKHCGGGMLPAVKPTNEVSEDEDYFSITHSTHQGVAEMYQLNFSDDETELIPRLQDGMRAAYDKLTDIQRSDKNVKYYVSLKCRFYKPTDSGIITDPPIVFNSETCSLLPTSNMRRQIEIIYQNIIDQMLGYEGNTSGWAILNYVSLNINVVRYEPLKGSSYIDLPKDIKNKKACINIQNRDDHKCFLWSILAYLHPVVHTNNQHYVKHYKQYEDELNMVGITYPVDICDGINLFEQNNDISVNVFGLNKKKWVFPARLTKNKKERHVNLLYISNSSHGHYVLIKDLSRLLAGQINNWKHKKFICERCFHACTTQNILDKHQERCKEPRGQLEVYPDPGTKLKFEKIDHQHPMDFFIVADMETYEETVSGVDNPEENEEKSYTKKKGRHVAYSACYLIVSTDENFHHAPRVFKGTNCVSEFLDSLQQDVRELKETLNRGIKLKMTEEDLQKFENETSCHICGKDYHNKGENVEVVVKDHRHLTGIYTASAHQSCNLNYKQPKQVPIFFHNLKSFDAHFILQHVNPKKHGRVTCIPQTTEKYISFTIGDMVFKDSLAFTLKSLDDLVKTLKPEQLLVTRRYLENYVHKLSSFQDIPSNLGLYDETLGETAHQRKQNWYAHDAHTNFTDNDVDVDSDDDDVTGTVESLSGNDESEVGQSFYRHVNPDPVSPLTKRRKVDTTDKVMYNISDLPANDYRRHPYKHPTLTEAEMVQVDEKFQLMLEKGVYFYEYIKNLAVLDETSLPSQNHFYSSLNDVHITDKQYTRAQEVWTKFGMQTLWNYHDLYLIMDVLLLADVLKVFQSMCLNSYNIDPLHSYTASGFAWQAALRMTGVELDLLSDKEMFKFFEDAKRGGVSVISQRYAKANIPGREDYDSSQPSSFLLYVDMNNLYGGGMLGCLPVGEFEWINVPLEEILNTSDNAEYGYYVEVDIEYPEHLHDEHNDYPLAAEKIKVQKLSSYQKEMLRVKYKTENSKLTKEQIENMVDNFQSSEKLIPNLMNKTKYIVHYQLLKYFVAMKLEITNIHRTIRFKQRPWLKPFIDFNTMKRQEAKSDFEKDFFKLLNNAFFGKTMENIREHRDIDLVASEAKLMKLVAKPTFRNFTIFREDLIAVERYKSLVKLDKPIFIGTTVLDISKLLMYRFHYGFIKQKYPEKKSILCMTDTDSYIYKIETNNIHNDLLENHEYFDFSGYRNDHEMFKGLTSNEINHIKMKNMKLIGKMTDEVKGDIMLEFAANREKSYGFSYEHEIFLNENEEEVEYETGYRKKVVKSSRKCSGIKKSVVKKEMTFQDFKSCVFDGTKLYKQMSTFRSYKHQLYTVLLNKVALCNYGDKRWIREDGVSTYAHGHYRTLSS